MAVILLTDQPEKQKFVRRCCVLASCHVSSKSIQRLLRRSQRVKRVDVRASSKLTDPSKIHKNVRGVRVLDISTHTKIENNPYGRMTSDFYHLRPKWGYTAHLCIIGITSMFYAWRPSWLVGCFEDLRRFSDLSAISRLGAGDNQSLKS